MLRTPKDFVYDTLPKTPETQYKIASNDLVEFQMYSNDGFKRVDMTAFEGNLSNSIRRGYEYLVEFDGTVKLPVLGRVSLLGLTIREAENLLEEKYATQYNKPYILLRVTNRRVTVFPGNDGNARVINLENENTTLLEALALAGGMSGNGKAYKVKLIRGDSKNPKVFHIDLSTLDGFKNSNPVLQANDIIYVEARPLYAQRVLGQITPYISLITTLVVFFELVKRTKT
jgi:polysaccharide export outer membrane protein